MEERFKKTKELLDGKTVLITGGCGFIGSNLARRLLDFGVKLRIFDTHIDNPIPGVEYIKGDIMNFSEVNTAVKGADIVFHLSALLGVENIIHIPLSVMEVNLRGTVKILEAAKNNGVERFIYTSSSEVYGKPRRIPISEDHEKAPISTYGISKLAGEAYAEAYAKEYGMNITIIRYFNVYGPGQKERFVIPNFISRVMNDESPIIYGHGSQSRCYTYINDAINGTILAATLEAGKGEVFNIGNEEETTVAELAKYIIGLGGNNLMPIYKPFADGIRVEAREIMRRKPDILKAKTHLGFEITTSWREGVKNFMGWYLSNNPNLKNHY